MIGRTGASLYGAPHGAICGTSFVMELRSMLTHQRTALGCVAVLLKRSYHTELSTSMGAAHVMGAALAALSCASIADDAERAKLNVNEVMHGTRMRGLHSIRVCRTGSDVSNRATDEAEAGHHWVIIACSRTTQSLLNEIPC